MGIKYFGGNKRILVNIRTIGMFKINKTKFAKNKAAINPQTTSGLFLNNKGPGVIFIVINIAKRTAVVPDPGTPRDNIGTRAPPAAELLPASGAATPLSSPFPKVSSLFEILFSIV